MANICLFTHPNRARLLFIFVTGSSVTKYSTVFKNEHSRVMITNIVCLPFGAGAICTVDLNCVKQHCR